MAHGMGDMVAWESHDVSTKKTQEWRQEQVSGSHAPARLGWAFPQGTVALFRSPSRLSEPTGRAPCHLGMRAEQERTGLSMSPCGRRQWAGAAVKEGRAPGTLPGTQDTPWDPEGTGVCCVRSSQQLLGPRGSEGCSTITVGNVCWGRGLPQVTAEGRRAEDGRRQRQLPRCKHRGCSYPQEGTMVLGFFLLSVSSLAALRQPLKVYPGTPALPFLLPGSLSGA